MKCLENILQRRYAEDLLNGDYLMLLAFIRQAVVKDQSLMNAAYIDHVIAQNYENIFYSNRLLSFNDIPLDFHFDIIFRGIDRWETLGSTYK